MQDSLPNLIQNYSQLPTTGILIAACVALWRGSQKNNEFTAAMLTAQQQSNKELSTAVQEIAKESTAAIHQMDESNNRVIVAIERVHKEIVELRTQLAERPCIAVDVPEHHVKRARHGD